MASRTRNSYTSSSSHDNTDGQSSTDSHVLIKRNIPSTASKWELSNLAVLGIAYENEASTISDFMSKLKGQPIVERNGFIHLPDIIQKLLAKTKDMFRFSFDFEDPLGSEVIRKRSEVQDLITELQSTKNEMKKGICDHSESEQLKLKDEYLFTAWCLNLTEFWRYFVTLLRRWRRALQKEMRYTYLLMAFSKIFFLHPEGGDSYSEYLHIKNLKIHSIPDVRFITCPGRGDEEQKLVIVTEVKQYRALRGEYTVDSFNFQNVDNKVLGQHGIELLLERQGSFFYPGVVGMICIGTKIIFTYLEMSIPHFDRICGGEIDKNAFKSSISYTRPFDYMEASDRNEVLEAFFWFGFVQSESYSDYHADH